MPKILIWLAVVITGIILWLAIPDAIWKYIFFMRVPLIATIFLVGLPFIAQDRLSAMLKNLFVLRGKWQLTFVIVGAITTGMAIALEAYTILLNASDRFDLPFAIDIPEWGQYILAIILGLPVCWSVYKLAEQNPNRIKNRDRNISVILGGAIAVGILLIFAFARQFLFENESIKNIITQVITLFSQQELQGYISESGELNHGHLSAIAYLLAGTVIYIAIGLLFHPQAKSRRPESPALLYVLLLTGILSLLLSGATFFLDAFRIPVLVVFVSISAIAYKLFGVDHFFEIKKLDQNPIQNSDFKQVLDARLHHQQGDRTLVIVCASGGGIQASGWTVQVLTGLQQLLGKSFTKAISFISGVSGGSVGTMYYLDRFDSTLGYPRSDELENILRSSTDDSLDAVGWGLAYLDLWRFISLPFLVRPNFDRGTAIETDWAGEMKNGKHEPPLPVKTLGIWREQVMKGEIPIPIFNATIVEDGRRFLISPMTFNQIPDPNYIDFNTLYPNCDISVVTAARLSATFPYVSPICRPQDNRDIESSIADKKYHFADGGYFDNSGFVTMAEWLDTWLETDKGLNIKRVVILQINPFPKSASIVKGDGKKGWFMATIGPLLAMFKVRDPILAERNKSQADLLVSKWKCQPEGREVEIEYLSVFFPSSNELKELNVDTSQADFFDSKGEYQPPLSWKLSDGQKAAIRAGWAAIANPDAKIESAKVIQKLKKLWHEDWQMPEDIIA